MAGVSAKRQNNFFDVCNTCKSRCCIDAAPPITDERQRTIAKFLKEKGISAERVFVQTSYTSAKVEPNGRCIFLDEKTGRCIVHSVKPETCVAGPITFDINVRTGKIEWYLKMEKICSLAGIVSRNEKLLQKHLVSAKREILRLVQQLDRSDLKAILKRDEPETFKIDEDKISEEILRKIH